MLHFPVFQEALKELNFPFISSFWHKNMYKYHTVAPPHPQQFSEEAPVLAQSGVKRALHQGSSLGQEQGTRLVQNPSKPRLTAPGWGQCISRIQSSGQRRLPTKEPRRAWRNDWFPGWSQPSKWARNIMRQKARKCSPKMRWHVTRSRRSIWRESNEIWDSFCQRCRIWIQSWKYPTNPNWGTLCKIFSPSSSEMSRFCKGQGKTKTLPD